jgi:hypothetical protein
MIVDIALAFALSQCGHYVQALEEEQSTINIQIYREACIATATQAFGTRLRLEYCSSTIEGITVCDFEVVGAIYVN